ncbi:hypothetical protein DFH07DRAFT_966481 [Mycena maculata]|uniref:Uncharacterized protein n=1 Tax=Mycena maculata TaxID=230809 RepID=A0AAD7I8G3_9AGAR|nr:hypothetical protein DFH07DRAFT_966481 [Mycena maculata]
MAFRDQWLCQANYIFSQFLMTAPHDDYCKATDYYDLRCPSHLQATIFIWGIDYEATFSDLPEEIPEGYLFLCPLNDLRSESGKFLECPECPAYWSLDPMGNERLNPEKASTLGVPTLKWNAGLGEFHAAKGFEPNSQDIVRHLGKPLYELSYTPEGGCARIEEVFSDERDSPYTPADARHSQQGDKNGVKFKP